MTAPSNANTSGLAPTDALRLVPKYYATEPKEGGGGGYWEASIELTGGDYVAAEIFGNDREEVEERLKAALSGLLAAPASPLPGGGQCSETSGELDPRLVEWGYTSMDEVIAHLGKLLDNQTAFDGLAAPTGEPK